MTRRLRAVVGRYVVLHFRSPARLLDIFFWPVMELFVWGFFTVYLKRNAMDPSGKILLALMNGLIFWDILYRSQQAMSLAFMEELWTRNVLNLLISPLRTGEWVVGASLYGLIKTGVVVMVLVVLATVLYAFDLSVLGYYFIPLVFNLLLMGWGMGLFTTGLLLRWGHSAEALIWGVPFLVQPFSAIFYPLSIYPAWLKPFCLIFPSTFVMEGMRRVVETGTFAWGDFGVGLGLNVLYLAGGMAFCRSMLERGRRNGRLVRMTG
jgi:ABC-2 type transport system permease protein